MIIKAAPCRSGTENRRCDQLDFVFEGLKPERVNLLKPINYFLTLRRYLWFLREPIEVEILGPKYANRPIKPNNHFSIIRGGYLLSSFLRAAIEAEILGLIN